MIKAVVFDLDDTLYPEHTYVDSGFQAVDHYLAKKYEIDGFYQVAKQLFSSGHRGKIFNKAFDRLAVPYQDELIKELVYVYRNHKPTIYLDRKTIEVLEYFSKHYKTALITDGYQATQRNKIDALGISQFFDFVCVTDEIGRNYWKPHEKPFITTENVLGVKSSDCVYIADNPAKDFVTPNYRGWKTIQLLTENGEYRSLVVESKYQAQFQVTSLSEVLCMLCTS